MRELTELHDHGVFLRREALQFGYDDRWLRTGLQHGLLHRVRHGAYVDRADWLAGDDVGHHVLRSHAVSLSHQPGTVLSHASGAALHGLSLWRIDLDRVHVTIPEGARGRKDHDVRYHRQAGAPEVIKIAGSEVLRPAACALGTAASTSVEGGIVVLDSAYRLGLCTEDDLRAEYLRMQGWPGTARLQVTLRLAAAGSDSVGESRSRYLFWAQGLPKPVLQYPVRAGSTLLGIVDFAWPEYGVLAEFDGRIKYGKLLRPGEDPSEVVYREKVREDRIREATGWRMVRISWDDLNKPARTAERLRRALHQR